MSFKISRREMLRGATLAAAVGAAAGAQRRLSALASVTIGPHPQRTGCDTLVALFLRGGADGLNIVVPYGDDDYYRLRPTLALARPGDRAADRKARALDLDGFFGLHPSLAALMPLYDKGQFAPIHAVGSGDQTRSHFEAMATMERGLATDTGAASGWLARHLNATARAADSPLRAVAISETMPQSLRGATGATALTDLADYRLTAPTGTGNSVFHPSAADRTDALAATLSGLYDGDHGAAADLRAAGRETLAALDAVKRLDPAHYRPAPRAAYPDGPVGRGLQQVACLTKGQVGLEVACLDMEGWDTHVAQGRDTGWQPARLAELGKALAAFAADLGPHLSHVTTVVMTEFGRRAYENTGLGTDHGRASCMFVLGGGVVGGKVHAKWPGLDERNLDGPGDLRVTTDYRDVLAEIVARRLRNPRIDEVFPGCAPTFQGIVRPMDSRQV